MTGIEIQRDGSPHTGGGENRHSRAHCSSRGSGPHLSAPLCLSVCSSWRSPGSSLPHMEMVRGLIHVKHDESVSLKKKRTKDETVVKIYRRVTPEARVSTIQQSKLSFSTHSNGTFTHSSCDKLADGKCKKRHLHFLFYCSNTTNEPFIQRAGKGAALPSSVLMLHIIITTKA